MFGFKSDEIVRLQREVEDLTADKNAFRERRNTDTRTIHTAWNKNRELRALNEKLYNAIDMKNAKLRAIAYKLQNPSTGFDVPVPGEFKESK